MNFEQLKVIWDSQSEESHYAINETELHSLLRQKSGKLHRFIFWQVFQTYASSAFLILMISLLLIGVSTGLLGRLSSGWDVFALVIAATGWMYFAGSVYFSRRRQKQRQLEAAYTASMRDELERDIKQVDYEIAARSHLWLGFLPPYIGALLFTWVVFRLSGTPEWAIVPFALFMVVAYFFESRSQQRLVDEDLRLRKRELVALRETLLSNEGEH